MKRTILYCVASSITLLILSFYFNEKIFDLLFSVLKLENISFIVTAVNSAFMMSLKMSLSIAIIPLVLLIAWAIGNIISLRDRIFSVLIVAVCIALAIMINVFRINSHQVAIANLPAQVLLPFEELYFEYAIIAGALTGSIISYFIFKKRKINKQLNAQIEEIGK